MVPPFEVAQRPFRLEREHPVAEPCLRRQLRDVERLELGIIRLAQAMILAFARLADIVPFVLVAADTERGLTRRAAVERARSEEHTSELQSLMRISYAVFCLKK